MREIKQVRILDTMTGFGIVYSASHMPVFRARQYATYWQALARIDEYHAWDGREYDLVCEPGVRSCLPDPHEVPSHYTGRFHGQDDYRTVDNGIKLPKDFGNYLTDTA